MSKVTYMECRYCDNPVGPRIVDGDKVCGGCGAEWNPIPIECDSSDYEID